MGGEGVALVVGPEIGEQPGDVGQSVELVDRDLGRSGEVAISGSKFVLAPGSGWRMPAEAIVMWLRSAVIMSSRLRLAAFSSSQAT